MFQCLVSVSFTFLPVFCLLKLPIPLGAKLVGTRLAGIREGHGMSQAPGLRISGRGGQRDRIRSAHLIVPRTGPGPGESAGPSPELVSGTVPESRGTTRLGGQEITSC